MPWVTPTLAEMRRLNRDNIAAALPGADAGVPNSVLRVLADSNAGLATLNLQFIEHLSKQFLPDTAEHEWLLRHAQIWLGGGKQATFAAGTVTVTGLPGTVLPSGTRMGSANGVEYETTEAITIGVGATSVAVRSLFAGMRGNQVAGASLSISLAVSGADGEAVVVTMAGGTDAESDDQLRERVLFRIQRPPMGGDADDYVAWARAVPGVTRAWCAPNEMGIGTVTVRVMMDELRADTGGYPTAGDLATVKAALDQVRPVAVKDFFVQAPIAQTVSFTVSALDADTTATRAAITAKVKEMLEERAAPASALNGVLVPAQTIHREWVSAAILSATGVESFELTMSDQAMASNGHMATLGTITFA